MINYKLIGTALLTVGSVVGIREYLKPRDIESMLKWKGINLITETNAWEASFYENEEALKAMQIDSHEKLKNWCASKMKEGISDELAKQAEQYCQDNPKTIFGNIIRAGEKDKFIKETGDNKDAQIIYVLSQSKKELKQLVKFEEKEPAEENFQEIGKAIAKWCNDQKKSKVENEGHLANVKKYCYGRGATNARELLDKEGFELLNGKDAYKKRFEGKEWSKATELVAEIKAILKAEAEGSNLELDKLVDGFKQLCDSKKDTGLTEKDFFPDNYAKFKARCATEKALK